MSVKEKLSRLRTPPGKKPEPISDAQSVPAPPAPKKSRFGVLADIAKVSGDFDRDLADPEVAPSAPAAPLKAVEPDAPLSTANPAITATPADFDDLQIVLTQDDIPEGSAFSLEQWLTHERSGGIDNVSYEIFDTKGRRLASMARLRSHEGSSDDLESKLFGRSLLISEEIYQSLIKSGNTPPPAHTTYVFRQYAHKPCVPISYMVTRNKFAMKQMPWLNGIVWRNMEPDASSNQAERDLAQSRQTNRIAGNHNTQNGHNFGQKSAEFSSSSRFSPKQRER